MGFLKLHASAQTLVFTGHGFRLAGGVLHLGNLLFQHLVFCCQCFVAEHIAIVFFCRGGQGGGGGAEGSKRTLHCQLNGVGVGNAAGNGKDHG